MQVSLSSRNSETTVRMFINEASIDSSGSRLYHKVEKAKWLTLQAVYSQRMQKEGKQKLIKCRIIVKVLVMIANMHIIM